MSKAQDKRDATARALTTLRELYPIGATVRTMVTYTSKGGTSRNVVVLANGPDGPQNVSHLVAQVIGARFDSDRRGVRMGGGGMDMAYAVAYSLGRVLYADAFRCIGQSELHRCPSNDHVNERTSDYTVGRLHSDAGYSLRHRPI